MTDIYKIMVLLPAIIWHMPQLGTNQNIEYESIIINH